jgi:hypothetical protein
MHGVDGLDMDGVSFSSSFSLGTGLSALPVEDAMVTALSPGELA